MAIQFCKFQETLFRKVVVIDEFCYIPVKIMHFFLLHLYVQNSKLVIFLVTPSKTKGKDILLKYSVFITIGKTKKNIFS
jgi:hypothetical protein